LTKLSTARGLSVKCSKISSLVHQSASIRAAFEGKFGAGKSTPTVNATRWNSHHAQLKCTANLDHVQLTALLWEQSHKNLVLTSEICSMSPWYCHQVNQLLNQLTGIVHQLPVPCRSETVSTLSSRFVVLVHIFVTCSLVEKQNYSLQFLRTVVSGIPSHQWLRRTLSVHVCRNISALRKPCIAAFVLGGWWSAKGKVSFGGEFGAVMHSPHITFGECCKYFRNTKYISRTYCSSVAVLEPWQY